MEKVIEIAALIIFALIVIALFTATIPAGYHEKNDDGTYTPVRIGVLQSLKDTFWR